MTEYKIQVLINDIRKYETWGKQFYEQSLVYVANNNTPFSGSTIHNGLKYMKAKMKLAVLQDNNHTDKEKEQRLKQIDIDIHLAEEIMRHDLEYRKLLLP